MTSTPKPRPLTKPILSAFGTSALGVFSGLLTNLWLIRIIARELPPGEFGVYAVVVQVTNYLGMLQLGLDFAASRSIAERRGAGDSSGAAAAYQSVRRFNHRLAPIVLGLVIMAAAVLWAGVPGFSRETGRLAGGLVLLTGAGQVALLLSRASSAALVGSQHQVITNLWTVALTLGTTVTAYVLFRAGLGVYSLAVSSAVLTAVGGIVLWGLARARCPFARAPVAQSSGALRSLIAFGGFASLGGLAWTVEATSDVMILGWLAGPAAVATYILWWRFPSMIFDLSTRLTTNAFPALAERHGEAVGRSGPLLQKLAQVAVGFASLAVVGISMWLPSFVRLWVGNAYSLGDGEYVALLMGCLVAARIGGNLLSMYLLALGNARATALLNVLQAAAKLAVGIPLAWRLGIAGLLIGSCVASAVQIVGSAAFILGGRGWRAADRRCLPPVGVALAVACIAVARPIRGVETVAGFSMGVGATVAIAGLMWLAWAWSGPLRPNLEAIVRRASSIRRG